MGSRSVDIYKLRETLMENQKNYFFDSPKLSVVVKTHNDEKRIIKCLQALSKQTVEEIEIIVVDDNSTDATYSLACTYSEVDNRVKVFKNKKDLDISELVRSNKVITIPAKKIVNRNFVAKKLKSKKSLFESLKSLFDYKRPIIKNNTFIVWEPCSKSHAEVIPGYVKYLLDLGYHVSVCISPINYKMNVFARFKNDNLDINKMSEKQVKTFFKKDKLLDVKGVLITSFHKLCDEIHLENCYKHFNSDVDKTKLFFVSHDIKKMVDSETLNGKLITLRDTNYKSAKTTVVNPHYFGDVKITPKNNEIINFITIGVIRNKRKNANLFVDAAIELLKRDITNFKITVVGKGHISDIPKNVRPYFDIKGHLDFKDMYDEIENADFLLTSYELPKHIRYNTTGTSGNFQLVYGFLKPIIIKDAFAKINGFTDKNSILYKEDVDFVDAMISAINMSSSDYEEMQEYLKTYAQDLYQSSLQNLKELING